MLLTQSIHVHMSWSENYVCMVSCNLVHHLQTVFTKSDELNAKWAGKLHMWFMEKIPSWNLSIFLKCNLIATLGQVSLKLKLRNTTKHIIMPNCLNIFSSSFAHFDFRTTDVNDILGERWWDLFRIFWQAVLPLNTHRSNITNKNLLEPGNHHKFTHNASLVLHTTWPWPSWPHKDVQLQSGVDRRECDFLYDDTR